jgi:hypothetical protein
MLTYASILLLNHLHEILGVYYDLGVCANGCTAVRKQMEAEVAALAPLVVDLPFNALTYAHGCLRMRSVC